MQEQASCSAESQPVPGPVRHTRMLRQVSTRMPSLHFKDYSALQLFGISAKIAFKAFSGRRVLPVFASVVQRAY